MNGCVSEPKTIEFINSNCGRGDIIHAGTYFGDFLPGISRGCEEGAIVWAFEPNLENYKCAMLTAQINGLNNVKISNFGLGKLRRNGILTIKDQSGQALGGA
ncbi:MAG: hypothetical protein ACXACH_03630, partial [Candidatus Hermodarchaeia archaeon]